MIWLILAVTVFIMVYCFTPDNPPQKDNIITIDQKQDLVRILQDNIGNIVTIQSKDFTYIYENQIIKDPQEITGKILEVDDDWFNIEIDSRQFVKKDSLDQLIFRIDRINSFFVNIE